MRRRLRGWRAGLVLVALLPCFAAASVHGIRVLASRTPLREDRIRAPQRGPAPSERAFYVKSWGRLCPVTVLPGIVIRARRAPFTMTPYPAPTIDEPAAWGLRVRLHVLAPGPDPEPPASVMASRAPLQDALAPATVTRAPLPETPTREEIAGVMGAARARVQRCYEAAMVPGQLELELGVEGESGRVVRVVATGVSATSACVERVVRALRWPRFARREITISYPYVFR
jgi:hypothetical protein